MPSLLEYIAWMVYPTDCQSIHIICPDDASYITLFVCFFAYLYVLNHLASYLNLYIPLHHVVSKKRSHYTIAVLKISLRPRMPASYCAARIALLHVRCIPFIFCFFFSCETLELSLCMQFMPSDGLIMFDRLCFP